MTYDILFAIAYMLGLILVFCLGYICANVHTMKSREKLIENGASALKSLWDKK